MKSRLDKLAALAFQLSRSQARDAIRAGRVALNGQICRDPALQATAGEAALSLDGQYANPQEHFYLMMYKPAGVLSATRDGRQQTALDLLPDWYRRGGIVGRLDKDAEGLLLITDDGEMNHRLTSPRWHAPKRYLVRTDAPATPETVRAFARGISLVNFTTAPAELAIDRADPTWCQVTVEEGKYHQIKRMFGSQGIHVVFLKRLTIGPLQLDPSLLPGEFRHLKQEEIFALQQQIGNLLKNYEKKS